MVQNIDFHFLKSYYFFNNTAIKVQTQKTIVKDFHFKKPRAKNPKPLLPYTNMAELLKQSKKDKKKKTREYK